MSDKENTPPASTAPPQTLVGKVALVTGGSRGIGRQIAVQLAARGASVVFSYVHEGPAQQDVVREIQQSTTGSRRVLAVCADMAKVPEIEALFEKAVSVFGKIDIVMSNAGIEMFAKLEDTTPEMFDQTFAVNTRGQFFVARQAYKYITPGGRLILMGSVSAQAKGIRNHAVYQGSKCAIEAFVRAFAADFEPKRVTVNAVAPGGVKTDMYTEASRHYMRGPPSEQWRQEDIDDVLASLSPLGRVGVPEDVSKVVAFLASDDAAWINGQTITITGGAAM